MKIKLSTVEYRTYVESDDIEENNVYFLISGAWDTAEPTIDGHNLKIIDCVDWKNSNITVDKDNDAFKLTCELYKIFICPSLYNCRGFKATYFLFNSLLKLFNNKKQNDVIMIREPETSIHINQQGDLLEFIVSHFPNTSIIINTNSPFVLSGDSDRLITFPKSELDKNKEKNK
jgi:hypothetical protein